jgi:hypothetical protein
MKERNHPKIAFVGWNPFQFLHFKSLISEFPDATLLIEDRKGEDEKFDFNAVIPASAKVVHRSRKEMRKLDGEFDILVCQTPFAGIENIRRSRIAMLQYGYAKEAHNFAPWRSFADVCLTFGDYATRKIETYCPCVATGNPRYADWGTEAFHTAAKERYSNLIDPNKATILYAPTWGPLSSFAEFSDSILALSERFNVILKVHHNSLLGDAKHESQLRAEFKNVCESKHDIIELLSICDVLISDFSGAIYDAIYCEVPVILLDPSNAENADSSICDSYSIERSKRSLIGLNVTHPSDVAGAVVQTMNTLTSPSAANSLRGDLFINSAGAARRAAEVLLTLASDGYPRSQSQHYIRAEMRKFFHCRSELSASRSVRGFFRMISNQALKR